MTPPLTIDLNCDLGEDPRRADLDHKLLRIVTSANIACGGHAGDDASMERTVREALAQGVALGAHPSFQDRPHFGRLDHNLPPDDIEHLVFEQTQRLAHIAQQIAGPVAGRITHIKPHGALYHAAMTRAPVALAIARAAKRIQQAHAPQTYEQTHKQTYKHTHDHTHTQSTLTLVGLAGSPALALWRAQGCNVAAEAFADRAYLPDGSLTPRTEPGALLTAPLAVQQALNIAQGRGVHAHAHTLCIHSDTPDALAIAQAVRSHLEKAGILVASMRSNLAQTS
jgi:5-oxoprolinase (ATP-hydrolysing) subunit A